MKLRFSGNAAGRSQPDPYMFKAEGKYYIYATGRDGVQIYRADSPFGEWEYLGIGLSEEGCHEYWAPCVVPEGGRYYMYYSSFPSDSADVHEQAVKVAVSDRPDGGFRFVKTMLPPFSIDPHVVRSGGDWYIFYSVNDYTAERQGTYIVVDKMTDMLTAEGHPVPVVRPTMDEEIFRRDRFEKGKHWHTIEGAFYLRVGDDHFCMYSGNCYENEYYFVGYAHARGKEDDLRKLHFEKYPDEHTYAPLLMRNAEESGTGHNSVLEEGGKYYIVYHGRDADAPAEGETRTARIREMRVENGKPPFGVKKIRRGTFLYGTGTTPPCRAAFL